MAYKPSSKEEERFLADFDASEYRNPALAADVALFAVDGNSIKLLLIARGGFPYKGCWALPGGFVDMDEDIIHAAKRELMEETGVAVKYLERCEVWGKPGRDPRQRVVTVSYIGLVDFGAISAEAGDDAAAAEWFEIVDYKKSVGQQGTRISYTLSGTTQIAAQVVYPNSRIQQITAESRGGLAFDHAESIAVSLELLKSRAQDIARFSLEEEKAAYAIKIIRQL